MQHLETPEHVVIVAGTSLICILSNQPRQLMQIIENMDTYAPIEIRCFQDPNIMAPVVSLWHLKFCILHLTLQFVARVLD